MGFEKKTWQNRTGLGLDKFFFDRDTTTKHVVESAPDSIAQEGTPLKAETFNDLEDRIAAACAELEKAGFFVIDSNEKFQAWATNAAGYDYQRVFIATDLVISSAYTIYTQTSLIMSDNISQVFTITFLDGGQLNFTCGVRFLNVSFSQSVTNSVNALWLSSPLDDIVFESCRFSVIGQLATNFLMASLGSNSLTFRDCDFSVRMVSETTNIPALSLTASMATFDGCSITLQAANRTGSDCISTFCHFYFATTASAADNNALYVRGCRMMAQDTTTTNSSLRLVFFDGNSSPLYGWGMMISNLCGVSLSDLKSTTTVSYFRDMPLRVRIQDNTIKSDTASATNAQHVFLCSVSSSSGYYYPRIRGNVANQSIFPNNFENESSGAYTPTDPYYPGAYDSTNYPGVGYVSLWSGTTHNSTITLSYDYRRFRELEIWSNPSGATAYYIISRYYVSSIMSSTGGRHLILAVSDQAYSVSNSRSFLTIVFDSGTSATVQSFFTGGASGDSYYNLKKIIGIV